MKRVFLVGVLLAAFGAGVAHAQSSILLYQRPNGLGTVRLTRALLADGKPLAPGTYEVRLTNDNVPPAAGQSPYGERYVEFLQGGEVVGREVAIVVFEADIDSIAERQVPRINTSVVEMLRGGDYWRVWINKDGTNYILNMPPATP